jgi:pyrroline-5-carboxylate reductase
MQIGLIGCGNMARALARGWGEPVLCYDPASERAQALASETGGEALSAGVQVAERADVVVLCHKPAQLSSVAEQLAPVAKAVASILAATPLAALREAYPGIPTFRFLPALPNELRRGAIVMATDAQTLEQARRDEAGLFGDVQALFGRLGTLVALDDSLVDVAMGLMSCAPAYAALVAEAQIDAGVRSGIPPALAAQLVVETLGGTAELLRARDFDTLAVRREVASPGGITARGLAALERGGIRAAFSDALDAVLEKP